MPSHCRLSSIRRAGTSSLAVTADYERGRDRNIVAPVRKIVPATDQESNRQPAGREDVRSAPLAAPASWRAPNAEGRREP
jgi:hypothetical protein